ncbi:hypothetical protein ACFWMV_04715 [Streptomyces mutabilis]|uniref:hypothetical protein n=1 Tax=Streptomyces mutabilis TaxID=67332 RepID=UPI003661305A
MSLPEWLGDMPTWIGASGAIGAAWFAYQTITSQRQQIGEQQAFIAEQTRFMDEQRENLQLERLALQAQAEERMRAQAMKVELLPRRNTVGVRPDVEMRWLVEVINRSSEPIRDVTVRFGQLDLWRVQARGVSAGERVVPVLGAGDRATFYSQAAGEVEIERFLPVLLFTDNAQVPWQRDTLGNLTEDDGT